jgi:TctA family transporter
LFSWPIFPIMMLGILLGMFIGIIPGLGGLIGMAMLLPFAIGKSPEVAFAFLLGMYAVTTQTDTIPAVLLGVPGTVSAAATSLDGYPLAQKGEAGRALSASYLASIVGTIVAAAVFIAFLPFLRGLMLLFASPEFFMLTMLGMVMIGSLAGDFVQRGLIMAGVGLVLAMIGLSPNTGEPRFVFNIVYLWEGIPFVPLVLGLFAIPESIDLMVRQTTIAQKKIDATKGKYSGFIDIIRYKWVVIKCGLIGTFCGAIPGLGGPVAEWFGYAHAVQTLGYFLIIGLQPGPDMLTTKLDLTFMMIWTIVLGNIIAAILALMLQPYLVRMCYIRANIIVPLMLGFMVVGASITTKEYGDIISFGIFGFLGYILKHTGWPRVPLIMGLVLGKLAEPYLFITVDRYGASFLWGRPITVIILGLMVLSVALPLYRKKKQASSSGSSKATESDSEVVLKPWHDVNWWIGLFFTFIALWIVYLSAGLSLRGMLFPWVVGIPLIIVGLIHSCQAFIPRFFSQRGSLGKTDLAKSFGGSLTDVSHAVLWIVFLLVCVILIGHRIAVPLFVFIYFTAHKEKIVFGAALAAGTWAFIYFVLQKAMSITFSEPVLFRLLGL